MTELTREQVEAVLARGAADPKWDGVTQLARALIAAWDREAIGEDGDGWKHYTVLDDISFADLMSDEGVQDGQWHRMEIRYDGDGFYTVAFRK